MYVQINPTVFEGQKRWQVWLGDPDDEHAGKAPWLLRVFPTEDQAEEYLVKLFTLEIRRVEDV